MAKKPPRNPFFDSTKPPNDLDCRDAIDRTAWVIDLLISLDLDIDSFGGLSERGIAGYRLLLQALQETLSFTSDRLGTLNGKRYKRLRRNEERVKGLMKGLSAVSDDNRNLVLNTLAAELDVKRSKVNKLLDKYTAENSNDDES